MVSLFADGMLLYRENPKDAIKKILQLINEFSKVAGYKLNTHKSAAFLYNNNQKSEKEIKEKNSIYHGIKKNRILRNRYT